MIEAVKKKKIKFIKKIFIENINGDFSHAEDICKGIYKISVIDKNIEKIILSSGKRFYLNSIIDFLEKKFDLKINKNNLLKDKKNFKAIGSNYLAKKILNYKSKKTPIDVCKEILKNYE